MENNLNSNSKDLMRLIQSKFPRLSKGQKLIAEYILKSYDKAAFMTAAKLGVSVGVSEKRALFSFRVRLPHTQSLHGFLTATLSSVKHQE